MSPRLEEQERHKRRSRAVWRCVVEFNSADTQYREDKLKNTSFCRCLNDFYRPPMGLRDGLYDREPQTAALVRAWW